MNIHLTLKLLVVSTLLALCGSACKNPVPVYHGERELSFNTGWLFLRDSTVTGAEQAVFDDAAWTRVDLPHDWSVAPLPGGNNDEQTGPFSKKSPGASATGNTLGGTGWYRNHFRLDKTDEGKNVVVRFDGSYMETSVWVNGKPAGEHTYGYTPFYFDITSLLNKAGTTNTIAVKVVNPGKNSRWYSGSGLYRNVTLTVTDPVHVAVWGVHVNSGRITADQADLSIAVTVQNNLPATAQLTVKTRILGPGGNEVLTLQSDMAADAGKTATVLQQGRVNKPALWSVDSPQQYFAEITLERDGKVTDVYKQSFGIRSIAVSAAGGLLINGVPLELKGGCLHHDNGLLGSAAIDRAEVRRIQIMKAAGYNAIRTSHNPPSEAFLNACDSIGIIVIDEAFDMWERPKNPQDYHRFFKTWWKRDLESMVLRDRNHPSVVFWSIGNEINERADTSGVRIAGQLVDAIRDLDSSRFFTGAVCWFWDHPELTWKESAPAFRYLTVGGYNYQWRENEADHKTFPERVIMSTESFPLEVAENWEQAVNNPWVIGDFVWTAMDYLGEAGIGHTQYLKEGEQDSFVMPWPWFNAWCGDLDILGNPKPQMQYKDVIWGNRAVGINVHAPVPEGKTEKVSRWGWPDEVPAWEWKGSEGKPLQVSVYAHGSAVKLELNGKAIGEQELTPDKRQKAVFTVPYEPGTLTATTFENGKALASTSLKTPGEPVAIRLTADRNPIKASRNDLCYVTLELVDQAGNLVTRADTAVRINFWGNGQLAGSGNASPTDIESFGSRRITTFQGKAMLIFRPFEREGTISVQADVKGLKRGSLEIKVADPN